MPEIVARGRRPEILRVRILPPRRRSRWTRKLGFGWAPEILHHSADGGLQERRSPDDSREQNTAGVDDCTVEIRNRCRGRSCGGLLFVARAAKSNSKVAETDMVPKPHVAGLLWAAAEGNQREPIGKRVVEVPDDLIRFESRDARSTFTAYVPVGSLAKGEALVTVGGSGKTIQCGVCRGPDLRGLGPLPSIAGRSPSYIFRQLCDFQDGGVDRRVEPPDGASRCQSRRAGPRWNCGISRLGASHEPRILCAKPG